MYPNQNQKQIFHLGFRSVRSALYIGFQSGPEDFNNHPTMVVRKRSHRNTKWKASKLAWIVRHPFQEPFRFSAASLPNEILWYWDAGCVQKATAIQKGLHILKRQRYAGRLLNPQAKPFNTMRSNELFHVIPLRTKKPTNLIAGNFYHWCHIHLIRLRVKICFAS